MMKKEMNLRETLETYFRTGISSGEIDSITIYRKYIGGYSSAVNNFKKTIYSKMSCLNTFWSKSVFKQCTINDFHCFEGGVINEVLRAVEILLDYDGVDSEDYEDSFYKIDYILVEESSGESQKFTSDSLKKMKEKEKEEILSQYEKESLELYKKAVEIQHAYKQAGDAYMYALLINDSEELLILEIKLNNLYGESLKIEKRLNEMRKEMSSLGIED